MADIRFTLRIPEEIHATLKDQAATSGRSMNEQIVYSLTRYLGVIDPLERRVIELERKLMETTTTQESKP